ncbi:glycosyltransferase family 2 protein [Rubrivivax sp. JA1024]|nr:glycosyltransferase family 2 protein [Rubrivivax sp. JA1024]
MHITEEAHDPLGEFARANALLRAGRPQDAAAIYRALQIQSVVPGELLQINLDIAHKLGSAGTKTAAPAAAAAEPTDYPDDPFEFARWSLGNYLGGASLELPADPPKVSVVMTCFNARDTIREAVESLLFQDYPDLEVVVCDDHSSDGTWQVLQDTARRCRGVRVLRNNSNYGTYLSKNRAIDVAAGEIILLQDSDDISHPQRVSVQVAPLLANPRLMATRTKYLRYDEGSQRIVPIAGLASKYGLITLAVRRWAFDEIGFFDAVRRAGDDEWVQRLTHLFGPQALKNLDVTLYLARLRQNSLVADMIRQAPDGSVVQGSSPARREYVGQFTQRFSAQRSHTWFREAFPPFPTRPQAEYPKTVRALAPVSAPVHASLCSIPSRYESLRRTIASLERQVDHIHLYLDKYPEIPQELRAHPKLTIRCSQQVPQDLRDNAKFLPFNALKSEGRDFYFFCCDDDIRYPHDYVHTMVRTLDDYSRRVVAGVHGVVVEESPRAYFRRRFNYHFALDSLDAPRCVNNLGTGTVAFHSSLFDAIDPMAWERGGMVDIYFSLLCRRLTVPMLCIPRHAGWLREFEPEQEQETPTLYAEFHSKEELITQALRSGGLWGFAAIAEAIAAQPPEVRHKLLATLPPFADEIDVGSSLMRLR